MEQDDRVEEADDRIVSRRGFLAAAAATVLPISCQQSRKSSPVKAGGEDAANIFNGIAFTDQNGKPFDVVQNIKDQQAVVLFGYGGCPVCAEITKTVAATQQKLLEAGIRDVPVVVVSAQPEKDRKNMPYYIGGYYESGVKQFADEKLPENDQREFGEESLKNAANKPQSDRILHVICPPKDTDTQTIQQRIADASGVPSGVDTGNTKQHSPYLFLFDHGKLVKPSDGKGPFKGVRLADGKNFTAPPDLVRETSDRILNETQQLRAPERMRRP